MDATCFVGGVVECDLFCCSYCCSFAAMLYYPALLGDTDSAIRSWYVMLRSLLISVVLNSYS
jgi:hypothetical protein